MVSYLTRILGTILIAGALGACATDAPTGNNAGAAKALSPVGLAALDRQIADNVAAHKYPGATYFIIRDGVIVHQRAVGVMDVASNKPMREDTIFRLASMSKPIVAVGILMLVEEGKIGLDDPVSRYIPELASMRVVPENGPPEPGRPITIRHLLTHTSGLDGIRPPPGAGGPAPQRDVLAIAIPRMAQSTLAWQPGSRWAYSPGQGFDVLGRVIEVASGQTLDVYLKRRIFDPLGMKDTAFVLTEAQKARLVTLYEAKDGQLTPRTSNGFGAVYFSGAGGLYSTGPDYARFAEMLARGGALGSARILRPDTVELMGSAQLPGGFVGLRPGQGWGLGVRLVVDPVSNQSALPAGSWGWSGAQGTHFWIDPEHRSAAVWMINLSNAGGAGSPSSFEYERLVAAATAGR